MMKSFTFKRPRGRSGSVEWAALLEQWPLDCDGSRAIAHEQSPARTAGDPGWRPNRARRHGAAALAGIAPGD